MKRIYVVTVSEPHDKELARNIYERVAKNVPSMFSKLCRYDETGPIQLPLECGSSDYEYVINACAENNLSYSITSQRVHYSNAELKKVAYFNMVIPYPLELEGTDAEDYGTIYTGGCPVCGLGKKPIGDVLVDRRFLRKCKMGVLFPDIYVSANIKDLILANGFTGVSFENQVKDYKNRDIPKAFVMNIQNVLPPMRKSTWLEPDKYIDKRYEKCGHQVVYLRSDIQYEKEHLKDAKDFNLTCEHVNNYRLQEIIVSAKVKELFQSHKVFAFYFPVMLCEE